MSRDKMSEDERQNIASDKIAYQLWVVDKLMNIDHRISIIEGGAKTKGAIWGGVTGLIIAVIAALVK